MTEQKEAAVAALTRGVRYLCRLQDPSGVWCDFWLEVGASDAWVTTYVGLALHTAAQAATIFAGAEAACTRHASANDAVGAFRRARRAAERAATALLAMHRPRRGWGYNRFVAPDADSTAHAVLLLVRIGAPVPQEAVSFLLEHCDAWGRFSTYWSVDPANEWAKPHLDVTAAALLVLYECGALTRDDLVDAWQTAFHKEQDERGWWHGYWWATPAYSTGLALEVWNAASRPPLLRPVTLDLPSASAFDLGWALTARLIVEGSDAEAPSADATKLARRLIEMQEKDGGWPAAPILRVPPSHAALYPRIALDPRSLAAVTELSRDSRRTFATATAVRALASYLVRCARVEQCASVEQSTGRDKAGNTGPRQHYARPLMPAPTRSGSSVRNDFEHLVGTMALGLGFPERQAERAVSLLAALTRHSFADPSPWPSEQLSSLSGGVPIEFSAVLGEPDRSALRYAVEVGAPYLPPGRRAATSMAVLGRVARGLGYGTSWERICRALAVLWREMVNSSEGIPPDLRFGVWGGIDMTVPSPADPEPSPKLKVYSNLLHSPTSPGLPRLLRCLKAAGIPCPPQTRSVLDFIVEAGFAQEIGFRLGPKGKWDCKLYFELPGWNRLLVETLLDRVGLTGEVDALVPEIPGILRESLASKERSGILLRLDTKSGRILDLATAAAFPPPMHSPEEIRRRVLAWGSNQGWSSRTYAWVSDLLLTSWKDSPKRFGRMHTLFTRTITVRDRHSSAAVYLRPYRFPNA